MPVNTPRKKPWIQRIKYRIARWQVTTGYGPEDHVRWMTKRQAQAYLEAMVDCDREVYGFSRWGLKRQWYWAGVAPIATGLAQHPMRSSDER